MRTSPEDTTSPTAAMPSLSSALYRPVPRTCTCQYDIPASCRIMVRACRVGAPCSEGTSLVVVGLCLLMRISPEDTTSPTAAMPSLSRALYRPVPRTYTCQEDIPASCSIMVRACRVGAPCSEGTSLVVAGLSFLMRISPEATTSPTAAMPSLSNALYRPVPRTCTCQNDSSASCSISVRACRSGSHAWRAHPGLWQGSVC